MKSRSSHIGPCVAHGQIVCECGTSLTRCKCKSAVPVECVRCFHQQTTPELFAELVTNAASARPEHPARMVWACQRIAKERKCSPDDVFLALRQMVKELTGVERFPGEALNLKVK